MQLVPQQAASQRTWCSSRGQRSAAQPWPGAGRRQAKGESPSPGIGRQLCAEDTARLSVVANAKREPIQGYTPANYITFAEGQQHRCHYMVAVEVDAPPSLCYAIWDDYARWVDFLDLVSQVGFAARVGREVTLVIKCVVQGLTAATPCCTARRLA
jgi:hypothetical protein